MHRSVLFDFRTHVPHRFCHLAEFTNFFQSCGWLRFFEVGKQLSNRAQLRNILRAHAQRNATRCAKHIRQHRHGVFFVLMHSVLKQQRRSTRAQGAIAYFGHFQDRRNRLGDAFEFTHVFKLRHKIAQVGVVHIVST